MQAWSLPILFEIVKDLKHIVPDLPIYSRDSELRPEDINLTFHPFISQEVHKTIIPKKEKGCSLCDLRISYKTDQFQKLNGKIPYLIIVQNQIRPKSGLTFSNTQENDLFSLIIEKSLNHPVYNFVVREALRCHFGKNKILDSRWMENCRSHIIQDIETYKIKGAIVVGSAATQLEKDIEKLRQKAGKLTNDLGIPTVYIPGPARLLYLQRTKAPQADILKEKKRIYQGLKAFKENVMCAN